MDLSIFITSGLIAALVSSLVAYWTSERRLAIENITQERTKWRDRIRSHHAAMLHASASGDRAALAQLAEELRLLLNPLDPADRAILDTARSLGDDDASAVRIEKFSVEMALLLKHDWERAKQEARPALLRRKVRRTSYAEYQTLLNHIAPGHETTVSQGTPL